MMIGNMQCDKEKVILNNDCSTCDHCDMRASYVWRHRLISMNWRISLWWSDTFPLNIYQMVRHWKKRAVSLKNHHFTTHASLCVSIQPLLSLVHRWKIDLFNFQLVQKYCSHFRRAECTPKTWIYELSLSQISMHDLQMLNVLFIWKRFFSRFFLCRYKGL